MKTAMAPLDFKPGYEQVFTVTDYYDGPLKGVAHFNGLPYFYDCIFDIAKDEYTNLYQLTPISQSVLEFEIEDWTIWKNWESAFHEGAATIDSHPALPRDKPRHQEIRATLDSSLRTDVAVCVIRRGSFERLGSGVSPKGVISPLQVRWSEIEAGLG